MSTNILDPFQIFGGDQIPRNGLVAEYLFNNNYLDTSGNGYDGINNGTTPVNDRKSNPNSAIQCVGGSSQYVDIDSTISGISSNTKGCISMWVKPVNVANAGTIIAFGHASTNTILYVFMLATGIIQIFMRTPALVYWRVDTDNPVLSNGTWNNIIVNQPGSPIIYVDNVAPTQTMSISTDPTGWFANMTLDNGRIGCLNFNSGGNANFITADLDDNRIYNRDLNASERDRIANE